MEYKVCAAQYIYDYLGHLRNPRYFADRKNLLLRRTYRLSSGYNSRRQKLQKITKKLFSGAVLSYRNRNVSSFREISRGLPVWKPGTMIRRTSHTGSPFTFQIEFFNLPDYSSAIIASNSCTTCSNRSSSSMSTSSNSSSPTSLYP